MNFSTRLNNHINHAKLLSAWLFRVRAVEKVAWYTCLFVFLFALIPMLRFIFSTPTLSGWQMVIGVFGWFAVMGFTGGGWSAWKGKKMRSHGFEAITPDKNLTRRICALVEPYATSDQNKDLQKIFEKNNMPWVWWEELRVLAEQEKEKQTTQTDIEAPSRKHPPFTRVGNVLHM